MSKKLLAAQAGSSFVEPTQWYATDWPRTNFGITTQDAQEGYYDYVNNYYYIGYSHSGFNWKATEAQVLVPTGSGSGANTGGNQTKGFTDAGNGTGYIGGAFNNRYVGWNYNGGNWTMKQYTVSNTGWEDICYTGTKWLMVGRSGDVRSATASLGSAWPSGTTDHEAAIKTALSNRTLDFEACASDGNGVVVVVGRNANNDEGAISTNDCSTWTKITDLAWTANTINYVYYAENRWVALGNSGKIYTSTASSPTSGNWTDISSSYPNTTDSLNRIIYDHTWGLWWVWNSGSLLRYTADFSTWSGNIYNDAVSSAGVGYGSAGFAIGQNAILIYGGNGRGLYGPL